MPTPKIETIAKNLNIQQTLTLQSLPKIDTSQYMIVSIVNAMSNVHTLMHLCRAIRDASQQEMAPAVTYVSLDAGFYRTTKHCESQFYLVIYAFAALQLYLELVLLLTCTLQRCGHTRHVQ